MPETEHPLRRLWAVHAGARRDAKKALVLTSFLQMPLVHSSPKRWTGIAFAFPPVQGVRVACSGAGWPVQPAPGNPPPQASLLLHPMVARVPFRETLSGKVKAVRNESQRVPRRRVLAGGELGPYRRGHGRGAPAVTGLA